MNKLILILGLFGFIISVFSLLDGGRSEENFIPDDDEIEFEQYAQ